MKQIDLKAIDEMNEKVQNIDPTFLAGSAQHCYEMSIWAATAKAYTGEAMSVAKREWQQEKVKAYASFIAQGEANQKRVEKYGTSMIKDYIGARCGEKESQYEKIERLNNALGYLSDNLRTVISSLKQEAYLAGRG